MSSLISVINSTNLIMIDNNSFTYNSMINGIIYISSQYQPSQPILISNNNFTQNAAYYESAAIFIR